MDVNNRTLSKSMASRDYTLNGEMVIEREYQGSSIASVSIDIRSPAVDIANKLMEAFALESVGVIVRESSAARIIISLRVLRSVGNLVLNTDKVFPTPSTTIFEPSILCKFDDITVVPDIIMSDFVICEAPATFSKRQRMYRFHMIMDGPGYLPLFKYRTYPQNKIIARRS